MPPFNTTKYFSKYANDIFNSKIMAEEYIKNYEKVLDGKNLNETPPKLLQIQTEKFLPFE